MTSQQCQTLQPLQEPGLVLVKKKSLCYNPPSSPPTESLRDDIGTIRDARPSSTTELTVSKVGDFLEALRVKHQVSHAGVRAVYDFFIKENAQEIYEAYYW